MSSGYRPKTLRVILCPTTNKTPITLDKLYDLDYYCTASYLLLWRLLDSFFIWCGGPL